MSNQNWRVPVALSLAALSATLAACSQAAPTPTATALPTAIPTTIPTATATALPTSTPTPSIVGVAGPLLTENDFHALLTIEDVQESLEESAELGTEFTDFKALASEYDPQQAFSMDSWYGVSMVTADGANGVSFSLTDFITVEAAHEQFELIRTSTPGDSLEDPHIGNASAFIEVNDSGIAFVMVFRKGDKVGQLLTTGVQDKEPFLSSEAMEFLTRLAAGRIR